MNYHFRMIICLGKRYSNDCNKTEFLRCLSWLIHAQSERIKVQSPSKPTTLVVVVIRSQHNLRNFSNEDHFESSSNILFGGFDPQSNRILGKYHICTYFISFNQEIKCRFSCFSWMISYLKGSCVRGCPIRVWYQFCTVTSST